MTLDEIKEAESQITMAHTLITQPESVATFNFETERLSDATYERDRELLFFSGFWVGENLFVFCTKLNMHSEVAETIKWSSTSSEFVAIEKVRAGQKSIDTFIDSIEQETGIHDRAIAPDAWLHGFYRKIESVQ